MSSSQTITLFSERPDLTQKPSSFALSVVAHAGAVALLSLGLIYSPNVRDGMVPRHYTIRHLDLHDPKPLQRGSAGNGFAYPGPPSKDQEPVPGKKPAQEHAVLRQAVDAQKGIQTLVQPDLPDLTKLTQEMPVPTVVIWSPKKELVKKLVAPLPEVATASDVKPTAVAPNQEINLNDLSFSSTNTPTDALPVLPATTSPLTVHGPKLVQKAPVTTSQTAEVPTPTAIMSISDFRMSEGPAMLPPVNETVDRSESGTLAPRPSASGHSKGSAGGVGKEGGSGTSGDPIAVAGTQKGMKPGLGDGSGVGEGLSTVHIVLPRNGEFGAVIVGANLEEKFPEMAGVWSDRVAYTVYLHVGLPKSWILQYALPRTHDAAQAGNTMRLDAPWPFNIVRPNIPSDSFNSDAILVHGFVNQSGRFESLTMAFPPEFQEAKFVLDALMQWQFRPAAQQGQTQRVEVLLIIPEQPEPIADPTQN